jgi:hypothetical protein
MFHHRPRRAWRSLAVLCLVAIPTLLVAAGPQAAAGASNGLVAAYSFDEVSGSTAHDLSGNGNDATLQNASFVSGGKYGGAVSLNGTSSIVVVPDSASLDLTSGMTLEAWVRATSFSSSQTLIAKERPGGGFPYGLELDSGVTSGYASGSTFGRASASGALPLKTWEFVAVTYDGTTISVYVNGTLAGSSPLSGPIATSTGQLSIGADSVWGEYFAGKIDNVRIYNRAVSPSELQSDMNTAVTSTPAAPPPAPSPAAAYAFDEGSGMTAADSSGNGNTATLNGATWTSSAKWGSAVSFGGSSIVTATDSASLDATAGLTLEAWVYPTAFATSQTLIAKERSGGGFPYGLELDNGIPSAYAVMTSGANPRATATQALPLNAWSFVAAVYDGSSLTVYVGSTAAASVAASGTLATSTGTLSIGADAQWGEHFSGTIDNVRVYSASLTAAQVGSDMSSAVAGSSPPSSGDTTPPSAPSGLATSGVTQTGLTLSWSPSTDNVGVAGYDVYLNGTKVGTTTTTSYALSALSCGTTYTLAVDAYDAAGNVSSQSSISTATSACSAPSSSTANLWIDQNGGSCTRSATLVAWSDSAACGSFQAALNAAQAGDTVLVTCNSGTSCTYPPETLSNSKGSNTSRITIAAAAGYTVGFEEPSGSGTPVWLDELHNVNLTNVGFGHNDVGNGSSFDGNLRIDCSTNVTLTNSSGRRFHMFEGNANFLFKTGNWGNYGTGGEEDSSIGTTGAYGPTETCAGQSAPQPTSVTFDGVTWHDVFWGETTSQWGGSHPDCFEINGYTNNVTIENGQIYHCGNTFLSVYGNQGTNHNLVIQNMNFHDLDLYTWFGIQIHGGGTSSTDQRCGGLVFRNNTYNPNNPNASGPYSGLYIECAADSGYANTLVTGNTFSAIENHGSSDGTCETSQGSPYDTQWVTNTWLMGTPCGT